MLSKTVKRPVEGKAKVEVRSSQMVYSLGGRQVRFQRTSQGKSKRAEEAVFDPTGTQARWHNRRRLWLGWWWYAQKWPAWSQIRLPSTGLCPLSRIVTLQVQKRVSENGVISAEEMPKVKTCDETWYFRLQTIFHTVIFWEGIRKQATSHGTCRVVMRRWKALTIQLAAEESAHRCSDFNHLAHSSADSWLNVGRLLQKPTRIV